MTIHAFTRRRFSHAGTGYVAGAILLDMADGQFRDWRDVGLVREATAAEVAAFRGEPVPTPAPSPAKPRRGPTPDLPAGQSPPARRASPSNKGSPQ